MKGIIYAVTASLLIFTACEKNESLPGTATSTQPTQKGKKNKLELNIQGLEQLGSAAKYEGWLIVNGMPISTGKFEVTPNGMLAPSHFNVNQDYLDDASMFVLTIEPNPDNDPAPSDVHILAGAFNGSDASLTVDHPAALGDDFLAATGNYLVATPTTSSMNDEDQGIWFIDNSSGMGMAGLSLPVLPAGWRYEGWTVIGGVPLSTGTFLATDMADDAATFSGPLASPPFPGEDFIMNPPAGVMFPPDLEGAPVVISIEPYPDNSPAPFTLKPLAGSVPAGFSTHTTYPMSNNASSFPTGTASR
jgi:hypothetical protein